MDAAKFIHTVPDKIDWMVEGVIERGANGFSARCRRVGKAGPLATCLSLAMEYSLAWLCCYRSVKVALISREEQLSANLLAVEAPDAR